MADQIKYLNKLYGARILVIGGSAGKCYDIMRSCHADTVQALGMQWQRRLLSTARTSSSLHRVVSEYSAQYQLCALLIHQPETASPATLATWALRIR